MDTSKLTFAVFTLDESDHCFAGFHDPAITWNGWNCPFFYQHEVERMRVVWNGIDDVNMDEAVADTKMPADSPFLPIGSHSWTWFEADMGAGREFLLQPITTREQAEAFIIQCEDAGILWHFDDAPDTIISGLTGKALFTDAEAAAAHCRAWELREVMGDPFGLPVALSSAEGFPVFRFEWLQGNGAALAECHSIDYGDIARLTEEDPENGIAEHKDHLNGLSIGESWMGATTDADQRPFQLTRVA